MKKNSNSVTEKKVAKTLRNIALGAAGVLGIAIFGVYDEQDAKETLHEQGYTEVEMGGRVAFGCGSAEPIRYKFNAINAAGQEVSGKVCRPLIMGPRIQLN